MPARLPHHILLAGALRRVFVMLRSWLRYVLVAVVWAVFVPYCAKLLFLLFFQWPQSPSLGLKCAAAHVRSRPFC